MTVDPDDQPTLNLLDDILGNIYTKTQQSRKAFVRKDYSKLGRDDFQRATASTARFYCKFPRCGKAYSSTDAVRKHCRQRHTQWLRSRDQRLGTRAYCMPIGEHTWTDGERYL